MTTDGRNKETESVPLALSKDSIISLAMEYVGLAHEQLGTEQKKLSKEAESYLVSYDWPGGESELEHTVKKACILAEGSALEVEDFDFRHRSARSVSRFIESRLHGFMRNIKKLETFNLFEMVIPEVERSLIVMVMKETKGNQVRAAQLLGINRNTLRSKIKKLGIRMKEVRSRK